MNLGSFHHYLNSKATFFLKGMCNKLAQIFLKAYIFLLSGKRSDDLADRQENLKKFNTHFEVTGLLLGDSKTASNCHL